MYQRLYCAKRKKHEQFMWRREASLRHLRKQKTQEYVEEMNVREEDLTHTQITEIMDDRKPSGKKRGAPKYDMNDYKVVLPNSLR